MSFHENNSNIEEKLYREGDGLHSLLLRQYDSIHNFVINNIQCDNLKRQVQDAKHKLEVPPSAPDFPLLPEGWITHLQGKLEILLKLCDDVAIKYEQENGCIPHKFANDSNNFFINFINKLCELLDKILVYFNLKKQADHDVPSSSTDIQDDFSQIKQG